MPEAEKKKLLGDLIFSEIFIEETNPTTDDGLNHDIWINNQTLELFKKENGSWNSKGRIGDKNINSDWDEDNPESKAHILNKPDIVSPNMLTALEEEFNIEINTLENLITEQGIIGFDYDENNKILSIIRPNNEIDEGIELPICDGLKPGFIDVDTFLQVYQNKEDILDKVSVSERGVPNGFATLDLEGKVPLSQLNIDDTLFILASNGLESVVDPQPNKIYLVPRSDDVEGNAFDEYEYINDNWESVGNLNASFDLPFEVISQNDYNNLSPQEKEGKTFLITGDAENTTMEIQMPTINNLGCGVYLYKGNDLNRPVLSDNNDQRVFIFSGSDIFGRISIITTSKIDFAGKYWVACAWSHQNFSTPVEVIDPTGITYLEEIISNFVPYYPRLSSSQSLTTDKPNNCCMNFDWVDGNRPDTSKSTRQMAFLHFCDPTLQTTYSARKAYLIVTGSNNNSSWNGPHWVQIKKKDAGTTSWEIL